MFNMLIFKGGEKKMRRKRMSIRSRKGVEESLHRRFRNKRSWKENNEWLQFLVYSRKRKKRRNRSRKKRESV